MVEYEREEQVLRRRFGATINRYLPIQSKSREYLTCSPASSPCHGLPTRLQLPISAAVPVSAVRSEHISARSVSSARFHAAAPGRIFPAKSVVAEFIQSTTECLPTRFPHPGVSTLPRSAELISPTTFNKHVLTAKPVSTTKSI